MNTKIYSLVFDYNLKTVTDSGRHWAGEVYKNKDYIFGYTAASVATFLDKNPHLPYHVYTDNVDLFADKIDLYNVSTVNLNIIDLKEKINEWTNHRYSFWPLAKIVEMHHDGLNDALKLDNDLTCLRPIDELLKHRGAIVWKYERKVSAGRDYWGERKAAKIGLGTDDFPLYNTGVLGLSKEHHAKASDVIRYCESLIAVDISDVSRFPDAPGKKTNVWSGSEQTAVNFFFHKESLPIRESHDFFLHHCYEKSKERVLTEASYLLRR